MFSTRRAAFLIFGFLAYLFLRGIGDHGLLDPLEGLNAGVSLSMAIRGDLLHPAFGSLPYLGKTMGFWWLNALGLRLFGWMEFAVRFFPALGALGTAFAAWLLARRMGGARAANYAAVIAGSSLLTYIASQLAAPHTLFAYFTSLALVGIVYGLQERRFFALLHVFSVLAFIVYGPAGFLLPWLTLFLYAAFIEDERIFRNALSYWPGLAATFLGGGGYLLLLYFKNPFLLDMMRFSPASPAFGSFFSSLLLLFVGLYPWIGTFPEAFFIVFSRKRGFLWLRHGREILLVFWFAVFAVYGLFSGDGLALVAVLPASGTLAALYLANAAENGQVKPLQRLVLFEILFFIPLLMGGLLRIVISDVLRSTLLSLLPWTFFCGLFLFAGWFYAKTKQPRKQMIHMCLTSLLAMLPLAGVFDLWAEATSLRNVGRYLREGREEGDALVQYAMNRPSIFFYTAKESLLIDTDALPQIAGQRGLDPQVLQTVWNWPRRVFMIVDRKQQFPPSMPQEVYNLYDDGGCVVLSNKRDYEKIASPTPLAERIP